MSLTVRRENLPVRCEICHQTDLFDPETGNCMRCVPATVGTPLLRQNEAAVNNTKPDVSIEWAKIQAFRKKSGVLLPVFFIIFPNFSNFLLFRNFQLQLYFSIFSLLTLVFTVAFILNKCRCPNCRKFLYHPGSNCHECGAILESPQSAPHQ